MARPTTLEERKFIEDKVKDNWTSQTIADALGISIKTVNKWRQRIKKRCHHFLNGSSGKRCIEYV